MDLLTKFKKIKLIEIYITIEHGCLTRRFRAVIRRRDIVVWKLSDDGQIVSASSTSANGVNAR